LGGTRAFVEEYYHLKYSEIVVSGTIVDIEEEMFSLESFYGIDTGEKEVFAKVKRVTIDVAEVWRGSVPQPEFTFLVPLSSNYEQNYRLQDQVVVSCKRRPDLGGELQLSGDSGRFILNGDKWVCQDTGEGSGIGATELVAVMSSTDLDTITDNAELVIEGQIIGLNRRKMVGPDGKTSIVLTITFKTLVEYKGSGGQSEVDVVIVESGYYSPAWRRLMTLRYEEGQRWIVFLKMGEAGYYPFAGKSGWFRIEKDKMFYGGDREYDKSSEGISLLLETGGQ